MAIGYSNVLARRRCRGLAWRPAAGFATLGAIDGTIALIRLDAFSRFPEGVYSRDPEYPDQLFSIRGITLFVFVDPLLPRDFIQFPLLDGGSDSSADFSALGASLIGWDVVPMSSPVFGAGRHRQMSSLSKREQFQSNRPHGTSRSHSKYPRTPVSRSGLVQKRDRTTPRRKSVSGRHPCLKMKNQTSGVHP